MQFLLKRWNKQECYYQKKTERPNCQVKMMPSSGDSYIISQMPLVVDLLLPCMSCPRSADKHHGCQQAVTKHTCPCTLPTGQACPGHPPSRQPPFTISAVVLITALSKVKAGAGLTLRQRIQVSNVVLLPPWHPVLNTLTFTILSN